MAYQLIVTEEAQQDALSALMYYDEQKQGLGDEFIAELNRRYQTLTNDPQYYGFLSTDQYKKLRKVKIDRFPYIIVYQMANTAIIIHAVHNTHKRPRNLK